MRNKRKIRLNYKKILRNLFILFIVYCIAFYCKTMKAYNEAIRINVESFTEYAKQQNIELTQENYKQFINN